MADFLQSLNDVVSADVQLGGKVVVRSQYFLGGNSAAELGSHPGIKASRFERTKIGNTGGWLAMKGAPGETRGLMRIERGMNQGEGVWRRE